MYNVLKSVACLFGRIGFLATRDTELQPIDADLRTTRSGMYWEDSHALVTLENLEAVGKDEDLEAYPLYSDVVAYTKGAAIREGNSVYRVLMDTTPGIPVTNVAYFAPTSALSDWLRHKVEAAMKNLLSTMITRKKLSKSVKSLLEDAQLYTGAGNYMDKEVALGRFVGYQISFRNSQNLNAIISRLSTQFSNVIDEPLKIYLYHTSASDPVATFEVSVNKKTTAQWHTPGEGNILQAGGVEDLGGVYFLGYYEDDLPLGVQAINKTNYNFTRGNCAGCGNNNAEFEKWFKYISVLPIAIPSSALDAGREVFNWDAAQYYNVDKTFGLNLHLSIGCEITALICRQQHLFDEALKLQFAVDMLREMAFSTRVNRLQERTKQSAMFELDDRGESANKPQKGLKSQLCDAIDALEFDLSDIDNVCLPCGNSSGINYTSI